MMPQCYSTGVVSSLQISLVVNQKLARQLLSLSRSVVEGRGYFVCVDVAFSPDEVEMVDQPEWWPADREPKNISPNASIP